jgi:hypothetical protein
MTLLIELSSSFASKFVSFYFIKPDLYYVMHYRWVPAGINRRRAMLRAMNLSLRHFL